MTEENISIKITDEVANSVGTKIDGIAKSARNAFSELEKLQNSIRQIGLNDPISRLVNDMTKLDQTILRVNRSQQLQEAAAAKTALSQQRLATEVQRTQVEMAKVEGALQKAVLAENQASAASLKLQAAQQKAGQEAARLAAEQQKAATAAKALADAEDGASARIRAMVAASLEGANAQDRLAAATIRANAAAQSQGNAWQANAAAQTAAMRGYDKTGDAALAAAKEQSRLSHALELVNLQNQLYEKTAKNTSSVQDSLAKSTEKVSKASGATGDSVGKLGDSSELARHHLVNLGFQLQDIFVSLASGQKPLTVAIQQGAQIGGIASQAGVGLGTMAMAAAKMVARFIPLVAVLGGVVGVFATLKSGMSTGEKQFEGYAKGLGATSKEIKKLGDLTVTYTDMAKGLYQTIKDSAPSNAVTSWFSGLPERAGKAWVAMLKDALTFSVNLYGVIVGSKNTILAAWNNFPALFKAIVIGAYNDTGEALVQFINNTIKEINGLINALNSVKGYIPGLKELADVPTVAEAVFNKIEIKGDETSRSVLNSFSANIKAATESGQKSVASFYKAWTKNSQDSAKERIKKKYDDLYGDAKAEKQSDALRKINAELDSQLDNLFKLSDQRAIDQKFDQIQIQLSSQKIKLSKDEAATIKDKITAIQEAQIVQKAYNAIYEESAGAQKTFNAYIDAAKILFDQGAISAEQYEIAVRKANETYAQAVDPLHSFNREVQDQLAILKEIGPQQEALRQRLQVENTLRAQGKKLTEAQTNSINEQTEALRQATLVNDALNDIYESTTGNVEKLVARQTALSIALNRGIVSVSQYNKEMSKTAAEIAQLRVDSDTGDWVDVMTAATAKVPGAFQSMRSQVSDVMGDLYQDLDSGFEDAWANIFDGFDGFADSLTKAFKNMIGQLANILITRPLVLNIAAQMSGQGGGSYGGASDGGFVQQFGNLFGGSTGGQGGSGDNLSNLFSLAKTGKSVYDFFSSGTGSGLYNAWNSGGFSGVYNYGANAVSGWFGGAATGAAANAASGVTVEGLSTAVNAGADAVAAGLGYGAGSGASATAAGSTAASTGLSTMGAVGYGIGGAIAGYQAAGAKGAVTGAAGAVGGAYIGTMILPGIGTVIGAMLGSMLGSSVWGGQWETKDSGIALGVQGGELLANSFEYQKKKGGLFGKNKKRTRYGELPEEQANSFATAYDATVDQVTTLFDRLNVTMNDGVLDGLNMATTQISTKDKTEEQIQEEITKWFGQLADTVTSTIDAATGAGLGGYNFEALKTFVNNLYSVNEAVRYLNVGMYDLSVSGGKLAESLSAAAGGLEALQQGTAAYFDAFFTQSEKNAASIDTVKRAFEEVNIVLPDTRAGFRAAVEGIDITSQSGQEMFATMMKLASSANTYYSILESTAQSALQAAQEMAGALLSSALNAVARAIDTQKINLQEQYALQERLINDQIETLSSGISNLSAMSNDLDNALKSLFGTNSDYTKVMYDQGKATLQAAYAIAKAGGSLANFEGLSDALNAVSNNSSDRYGSQVEYLVDQAKSAALIYDLNETVDKQLTDSQKALKAQQDYLQVAKDTYEMQIKKLDAQYALAQAQVDAMNGIDNTITTVADALKQLTTIMLKLAPNGTGSTNIDTIIQAAYQSALGRNPDAAGAAYWKDQVGSGKLNSNDLEAAISAAGKQNNAAAPSQVQDAYAQLLGRAPNAADMAYWTAQVQQGNVHDVYAAIKAAAVANGQIPAFANGGYYPGGMALVGEYGPEMINFSGGGHVYTAGQTAQMMSGASNEEVVDRLDSVIEWLEYTSGMQKTTATNSSEQLRKLGEISSNQLLAQEDK